MADTTPDQDAKFTSAETVRDGKSRGGKMQPSARARGPNRQKHGAMTTPSGTSWLQVRADWETGAFSERGLADAHGIHVATLRARMRRKGDEWPPRPMTALVSAALPGLMDALPDGGDPDAATIESITAQIEGRPANNDEVLKERAKSSAQRKSLVLRNHRTMADDFQVLAYSTLKLLTDYSNGKLPRAYVTSVDSEGNKVTVPFHLLSKQHGLMDGVDKCGSILMKTIQLQRAAHGLEEVDGDGNPKPKDGKSSANPFTQLTDDELRMEFANLVNTLNTSGRVTPVPAGVVGLRANA